MLQATLTAEPRYETGLTLVDRVRDALAELAASWDAALDLWARSAGPHVLLGVRGEEAFARMTPLGAGSYGLAFRALEAAPSHTNAWEPLLLVDELEAVVEHALVALEAQAVQ